MKLHTAISITFMAKVLATHSERTEANACYPVKQACLPGNIPRDSCTESSQHPAKEEQAPRKVSELDDAGLHSSLLQMVLSEITRKIPVYDGPVSEPVQPLANPATPAEKEPVPMRALEKEPMDWPIIQPKEVHMQAQSHTYIPYESKSTSVDYTLKEKAPVGYAYTPKDKTPVDYTLKESNTSVGYALRESKSPSVGYTLAPYESKTSVDYIPKEKAPVDHAYTPYESKSPSVVDYIPKEKASVNYAYTPYERKTPVDYTPKEKTPVDYALREKSTKDRAVIPGRIRRMQKQLEEAYEELKAQMREMIEAIQADKSKPRLEFSTCRGREHINRVSNIFTIYYLAANMTENTSFAPENAESPGESEKLLSDRMAGFLCIFHCLLGLKTMNTIEIQNIREFITIHYSDMYPITDKTWDIVYLSCRELKKHINAAACSLLEDAKEISKKGLEEVLEAETKSEIKQRFYEICIDAIQMETMPDKTKV
ncbi:uncharacterized protein NEMAJ01_1662 [Nematocida major]|uniref:uncharacterized protein n=1 Tax=Nematocida major TaxID=1912982 RepID=UPI0020089E69|nr:uncharacterized protein NEMAJ01_1662 [Nematocida major]KAH9386766.1 hypothetical protein NEMAJ01_1662 [Nematocida major]